MERIDVKSAAEAEAAIKDGKPVRIVGGRFALALASLAGVDIHIEADVELSLRDVTGWLVSKETSAPRIVTRGTSAPRIETRETSAPSIETWGTSAPRIVTRGTSAPRIETWGTSAPRIETWGTSAPRIETRETSAPRIVTRETSAPRIVTWETSAPRIETWGTSAPRIETRETSAPRIMTWGTSAPSIETWGTSAPSIETWGTSAPRIVTWGTSAPRIETRETSAPRIVTRETSAPSIETWETSAPRIETRETSAPSIETWETSAPRMAAHGYTMIRIRRVHGKLTGTADANVSLHIQGDVEIVGGKQTLIKLETPEDWCGYYGVPIRDDGMIILFKGVDNRFISGRGGDYTPGTKPTADRWDGGKIECSHGLHWSPTPRHSHEFCTPTRYIAAPHKLEDIVCHWNGEYPQKVMTQSVAGPTFEVDIDGEPVPVAAPVKKPRTKKVAL